MVDRNMAGIDVTEEKSWFLYLGEIKAVGLNRFLVEPLTRRYGKPASCIHIVPDLLAYYPEGIFHVAGPGSDKAGPDKPGRQNTRMSANQFAALAAADDVVNAIIDRILNIQGELIINVFETAPGLSPLVDDRVKVIGPDPEVSVPMNNKLRQYKMAVELDIPVPKGMICSSMDEVLGFTESLFAKGGRVFVSEAYSAGGSNSIIASTAGEITSRFKRGSEGFLVTEFLEHRHDPTVLGVIAGENDIYIASVADQNIDGTRFTGSTFPTVLGKATVSRLKDITRNIGSRMGKEGYRGVFGCDFIVDDNGEVFFIEINARKQGTTMETTLAMIHNLPGSPTLPELEVMAVIEGRLPAVLEEMDSTAGPVCWGTYNFKAAGGHLVRGYIPPAMSEENLFRNAVAGRGGFIVLDHVGPDTYISPGGFIGRIVAAGSTPDDVREGLVRGTRQVQMSIEEPYYGQYETTAFRR